MNVMKTAQQLNAIGSSLIGAAIEVHKTIGPGLLESLYQEALKVELEFRGHAVKSEVSLPIKYREKIIGKHLRIDLVIDDTIIVEVKAVSELTKANEAQLLTYLKLTQMPLGYLINFHEQTLLKGLRRMVNNFPKAA